VRGCVLTHVLPLFTTILNIIQLTNSCLQERSAEAAMSVLTTPASLALATFMRPLRAPGTQRPLALAVRRRSAAAAETHETASNSLSVAAPSLCFAS
jgi:hypothetical protein